MIVYRVFCQSARYDLKHEHEAVQLMHLLAHLTGALVSMRQIQE